MKTVVVGIGSEHGDDQAAWQVIDWLNAQAAAGASFHKLSDPSRLLDLTDCDRLFVVDACQSGEAPGTLTRMSWSDPRIKKRRAHSTHGIGLEDALHLAASLDRLPTETIVFGIELQQACVGENVSQTLEHGLRKLERLLLQEIRESDRGNELHEEPGNERH